MKYSLLLLSCLSCPVLAMGSESWLLKLDVDKLQWQQTVQDKQQGILWDAELSVQRDIQRLWLKTQGSTINRSVQQSVVSGGYQRAFSPFWDWQAGIYAETEPDNDVFLLAGVEGMAPWFVHVHSFVLLNEQGGLRWHMEASHELRLSEHVFLLSDVEVAAQSYRDQQRLYGRGLTHAELSLRLAWQWQQWMPYVGVVWENTLGDTRRWHSQAGMDSAETMWVLGVKAWF